MHRAAFERLPDEIILEICLYLRNFDVINAFGQLNGRLNRTISQFRRHSGTYHLTLSQFHRWYTHLQPSLVNDIVSLVLCNWNSPGQIHLFNQWTAHLSCLDQLFPNIKQLRLIDFSNDDTDILRKLSTLDTILIDSDALKPLLQSTQHLLDRYLFSSSTPFHEIRLWVGKDGIRFRHGPSNAVNTHLHRLTIVVARLDDLILLLKRTPNLVKICVQINEFSSHIHPQSIHPAIMPRHLTDFHIQTYDPKVLTFEDLFVMVIHMPTLTLLSLDVDTRDLDYGDGVCWTILLSRLPNLKHLYFKIRLWIGTGLSPIDINPFLESFARTELSVSCYADRRVLHIDTVPYDMRKLETSMGMNTSPAASAAKRVNIDACPSRACGFQLLSLVGRHEPTSLNHCLRVVRQFSSVRALDFQSINISKENTESLDLIQQPLYLPHLVVAMFFRSTRSEINTRLFLSLVTNREVTPSLRGLTVTYGDLVHLCKRLPNQRFDRIQELLLINNSTDGRIIHVDMDRVLQAFPSVTHFSLAMHSSRAINRDIERIIHSVVTSWPNLISFRLLCKIGSLKLPSSIDSNTRLAWLRRAFADGIHLSVNRREISFWK